MTTPRTLALLLGLLGPAALHAQSCPAYDSLVGVPPTRKNHFDVKYDRVADSTSYRVDTKLASSSMLAMNTPDILLSFVAIHEGQVATAPGFFLQVSDVIARRNIADRVEDRTYLANIDNAIIVIDDSVRVRLTKTAYGSRVKDDPFLGRRLEELLTFSLTPQEWGKVGNGSRLLIRVGTRDITTGSAQSEGARNVLNRLFCTPPPAAAHGGS